MVHPVAEIPAVGVFTTNVCSVVPPCPVQLSVYDPAGTESVPPVFDLEPLQLFGTLLAVQAVAFDTLQVRSDVSPGPTGFGVADRFTAGGL